MLKINKLGLAKTIADSWKKEKLFYPLNSTSLIIQETEPKENNLVAIEIQNLPTNCWIFENEFGQNNKNHKQASSLSSAGKKVEKTIIWMEGNRLILLLIEMKTDLTFENVSDCLQKVENSLNTFSAFLAAHPEFQHAEKYISPMALICYNLESCKHEDSRYKSERCRFFYTQYIQERLREFLLEINPLTLLPLRIPFAFRINPTFGEDKSKFTVDFQDIYTKLTNI